MCRIPTGPTNFHQDQQTFILRFAIHLHLCGSFSQKRSTFDVPLRHNGNTYEKAAESRRRWCLFPCFYLSATCDRAASLLLFSLIHTFSSRFNAHETHENSLSCTSIASAVNANHIRTSSRFLSCRKFAQATTSVHLIRLLFTR